MSDGGSDKRMEFFVTGAKTYLDVDDAMAEFRRLVQDQCSNNVRQKLGEINQACEMNWRTSDLKDYVWHPPDRIHLGKKILVENLGRPEGGLYFGLELARKEGQAIYAALVYLYRERKDLAVDLWTRLPRAASDCAYSQGSDWAYGEGKNLVFTRRLSEDMLPDFSKYLDQRIDSFIAFISGGGGLKKYLVQGSQLGEPGLEPRGTAQA